MSHTNASRMNHGGPNCNGVYGSGQRAHKTEKPRHPVMGDGGRVAGVRAPRTPSARGGRADGSLRRIGKPRHCVNRVELPRGYALD